MVVGSGDNPRRARLRSGESTAMVRGTLADQSWCRPATTQSEEREVIRPIAARNSDEGSALVEVKYTMRVVRGLNSEARSGSSVVVRFSGVNARRVRDLSWGFAEKSAVSVALESGGSLLKAYKRSDSSPRMRPHWAKDSHLRHMDID